MTEIGAHRPQLASDSSFLVGAVKSSNVGGDIRAFRNTDLFEELEIIDILDRLLDRASFVIMQPLAVALSSYSRLRVPCDRVRFRTMVRMFQLSSWTCVAFGCGTVDTG